MGYRPAINCMHRDNWNRCRLHKAHWAVRWLLPKGRPACIEMKRRNLDLQDDSDVAPCPDQKASWSDAPYPPPPAHR